MDIQKIGQTLLEELQKELTQSQDSTKLAQGAIQGVQMFYARLLETEQPEVTSIVDSEPKSRKARKKK